MYATPEYSYEVDGKQFLLQLFFFFKLRKQQHGKYDCTKFCLAITLIRSSFMKNLSWER